MNEQTPGLSAAFIAQVDEEERRTVERQALRDPAWEAAFHTDGEYTAEQVKAAVHAFLMDYAWLPDHTPEQKTANVDCIMAQDGWQYVQMRADQFAGAQFEPGPEAFDAGVMNELSGLYECHDEPHQPTCPMWRP